MNKDLEKQLEEITTKPMNESERTMVWSKVEDGYRHHAATPHMAPRYSLLQKISVALVIFGFTGATAFASNGARPGDILFPVDRGIENIMLAIASDERKNELRIEFASERLDEIRGIITDSNSSDDSSQSDSSSSDSTATSSSATGLTEAQIEVFTNETVVKIELDNEKSLFTTQATGRDAIIDEILALHDVTRAEVVAVVQFSVEDRASRPDDKRLGGNDNQRDMSDTDRDNIRDAVAIALDLLNDLPEESDEIESALDELLSDFTTSIGAIERLDVRVDDDRTEVRVDGDGDNRIRIREDDDGRIRFESRNGDDRVEVRIKDGEVEVKVKDRGDDIPVPTPGPTPTPNPTSTPPTNGGTTTPATLTKVDIELFTDQTVVSIELADVKYHLLTNLTEREAIINLVVASELAVTKTQVEAVAVVEREDRASRLDDIRGMRVGVGTPTDDTDTGNATSTDDDTPATTTPDDTGNATSTASSTDDGTSGNDSPSDTTPDDSPDSVDNVDSIDDTSGTSTDDGTSGNGSASDTTPETDTEVEESAVLIEVRVRDGEAAVKTEIDGEKNEYTLAETEESAIVTAVASRTGLTEAEVQDVIQIRFD